ncbi:MAG: hypothetical protein J3Q66DRAFT_262797, partial [Benniella sp.]
LGRHPAAFVEIEQVTRHSMGRMDRTCPYCKAKLWVERLNRHRSANNPKFSFCCGTNGKIVLPELPLPPQELRDLYKGDTTLSRQFLSEIRTFNNAFAFTSLGCKMAPPPHGKGPSMYCIQGGLYHRMGSI